MRKQGIPVSEDQAASGDVDAWLKFLMKDDDDDADAVAVLAGVIRILMEDDDDDEVAVINEEDDDDDDDDQDPSAVPADYVDVAPEPEPAADDDNEPKPDAELLRALFRSQEREHFDLWPEPEPVVEPELDAEQVLELLQRVGIDDKVIAEVRVKLAPEPPKTMTDREACATAREARAALSGR